MKKIITLSILLAVLIGISWIGFFAYNNLRGVGPAVKKPPEDIVELIGNQVDETSELPIILNNNFSISIQAQGFDKPRNIISDTAGKLLISDTNAGTITAINTNVTGPSDTQQVILENLNKPHGLAYECDSNNANCKLYVAEETSISVYDYEFTSTYAFNRNEISTIPKGGRHTTRSLIIGNDDKLYISIGSSCDVCIEKHPWLGTVVQMNKDGSDAKVYSKGLRNAVFLAQHPTTNQIWVTEMGRDQLGDDLPPDEINILQKNGNFGWPICYGKNIHDTDYDKNTYIRAPCQEPFEIPSYIDIPAHSAPLGLAFFPPNSEWPKEYWNDLLVALHGSWNRTDPVGYKIVHYKFSENGAYEGAEDFAYGWLTKNGALGRPVDIWINPNGTTIYVSDDKAGIIYQILYTK